MAWTGNTSPGFPPATAATFSSETPSADAPAAPTTDHAPAPSPPPKPTTSSSPATVAPTTEQRPRPLPSVPRLAHRTPGPRRPTPPGQALLLIPFSDQPWDRLGIGRTTFYELVNTGRISTVHIGRRRLVHADEPGALRPRPGG